MPSCSVKTVADVNENMYTVANGLVLRRREIERNWIGDLEEIGNFYKRYETWKG